ncbi:Transcription factor GATA-5 [Apophysomyces ossiformis]|uniref:Transcription factor GATA-5 n=1 Tax=Apophysomyces ossiformis TaxID=679940 RepID=A0A8H7EKT5_9FUNG|nr:Transcription factor GATA-5 [Apophysomyces ossiformis]
MSSTASSQERQCSNCSIKASQTWYHNQDRHWLCINCYSYERLRGVPRPRQVYELHAPKRSIGGPCTNCHRLHSASWIRDRTNENKIICAACYKYLKRHGVPRPQVPDLNVLHKPPPKECSRCKAIPTTSLLRDPKNRKKTLCGACYLERTKPETSESSHVSEEATASPEPKETEGPCSRCRAKRSFSWFQDTNGKIICHKCESAYRVVDTLNKQGPNEPLHVSEETASSDVGQAEGPCSRCKAERSVSWFHDANGKRMCHECQLAASKDKATEKQPLTRHNDIGKHSPPSTHDSADILTVAPPLSTGDPTDKPSVTPPIDRCFDCHATVMLRWLLDAKGNSFCDACYDYRRRHGAPTEELTRIRRSRTSDHAYTFPDSFGWRCNDNDEHQRTAQDNQTPCAKCNTSDMLYWCLDKEDQWICFPCALESRRRCSYPALVAESSQPSLLISGKKQRQGKHYRLQMEIERSDQSSISRDVVEYVEQNEEIPLSTRIETLNTCPKKRRIVRPVARSVKRRICEKVSEYVFGIRRDQYHLDDVHNQQALPIPTTRGHVDTNKLDTTFHRYHRMHYREEYEAEAGFVFDDGFEDSYISGTHWCKAEKIRFFSALERCGRRDIHAIQQRVGPTKTVYEIAAYIDCLEEASQTLSGSTDMLNNTDPDSDLFIPHAFEMSDEWIKKEEVEALRLATVSEHSFLFMEKENHNKEKPATDPAPPPDSSETKNKLPKSRSKKASKIYIGPLTANTVLNVRAIQEMASRLYLKTPYAFVATDTIEYLYYELVRFLEDILSEMHRMYLHRTFLKNRRHIDQNSIFIRHGTQFKKFLELHKQLWKPISQHMGDSRINLVSAGDFIKQLPDRLGLGVLDEGDEENKGEDESDSKSKEGQPKRGDKLGETKADRIRASKEWRLEDDQMQRLEQLVFRPWRVEEASHKDDMRKEEAIGGWVVQAVEDPDTVIESEDEEVDKLYEADEAVEQVMRLRDTAYEKQLMQFLYPSDPAPS